MLWQNLNCDKTQIVKELPTSLNSNCEEEIIKVVTKFKLWQNSNVDKTQTVTNSMRVKTQIMTKLNLQKKENCDKTPIEREAKKHKLWEKKRLGKKQVVTKLKLHNCVKAAFFLGIFFPVEKLNQHMKCITRWVGKGGVTFTFFLHKDMRTIPALYKRHYRCLWCTQNLVKVKMKLRTQIWGKTHYQS